jgi:hypothetical protein
MSAPEDIIQYKRERKLYKEHLNRIHEAHPMVDSMPPSSLGLKHLETRPKKKQVPPLSLTPISTASLLLSLSLAFSSSKIGNKRLRNKTNIS